MTNKSLVSTMSDKVSEITREAGALIGSIATPAMGAAESAFNRATRVLKAKAPRKNRKVAAKRPRKAKANAVRKARVAKRAVKRTVRPASSRRTAAKRTRKAS